MKKSNIPEFIDFTKNLITVNAALIGGVFFKTKKSVSEVTSASETSIWETLCNTPITAYSAVLFTISILLLFGFIAGIIEHKDSPENPVLGADGKKVDETCVLGGGIVITFVAAFISFITGLSFLCISLF